MNEMHFEFIQDNIKITSVLLLLTPTLFHQVITTAEDERTIKFLRERSVIFWQDVEEGKAQSEEGLQLQPYYLLRVVLTVIQRQNCSWHRDSVQRWREPFLLWLSYESFFWRSVQSYGNGSCSWCWCWRTYFYFCMGWLRYSCWCEHFWKLMNPSGNLAAIDWDLWGQPDYVAVSPDGRCVVVTIENRRNEYNHDDDGDPAG